MKKTISAVTLSIALAATSAPLASATEPSPAANGQHYTFVSLAIAGAKPKTTGTVATTVGQLLAWRQVSYDGDDVVTPAPETPLSEGMQIQLDRVAVASKTVRASLAYDSVIAKTDSLSIGEKKIIKGSKGRLTRTYSVTTVNGKVAAKVLVSETVVTPAITKTILVGTNEYSHGHKLNLARVKLWNKIARCESGGNWHINTGNGYYGGLQFALGTWRANGGRDFAAKPHKASKAEQITVANRLYKKSGTRPWGCA